MSVGAKLIGVKLYFLGLYLYLLHRRRLSADRTPAKGITEWMFRSVPALLGIVSFGLAVYPATLLSRTWLSPLSTSPGASAIFLGTALLLGGGVAVILANSVERIGVDESFRARMESTLVFFIGLEGLLLVFEGLALHGNTRALAHALDEMLHGSAAITFWGLVVSVDLILPALALLAFPKNRASATASGFAVIIGACATRYIFFTLR
jgi:formate-dependent nitrite reductase membrane component NrfD